MRYDRTEVWRCVYEIDEAARIVLALSLDPHDVAYAKAVARRAK